MPFLPAFPLSASYLIDVPLRFAIFILVFNFAVWKYRTIAIGTHADRDNEWRSNRVADLAATLLLRKLKPKRKSAKKDDNSVLSHDQLLSHSSEDVLVCYTDGSASPNPGPGAGVSSIGKLGR